MSDWDLGLRAPEVCAPDQLTNADARALANLLARPGHPFARLLECRKGPDREVVVAEVEVEVPQRRVYPIMPVEPIAIVFGTGATAGSVMPGVLALRRDFPSNLPHTNLTEADSPTSLCLYEIPLRDLRAGWTAARFLSRIRYWLRLTARGELHGDDQPLEPLLVGNQAIVILPDALRDRNAPVGDLGTGQAAAQPLPLVFEERPPHRGELVFYAKAPGEAVTADRAFPAVAAVFKTSPRTHGALRHAPRTVQDLHEMLAESGDDLLSVLRSTVQAWGRLPHLDVARFILVIVVPKQRVRGGEVESVDTWAFLSLDTFAEVNVDIGLAARQDKHLVPLIPPDLNRRGGGIQLYLMNSHFTLTRPQAAATNGRRVADDRRIVAIGAGSLGSQVILNAARAAFGHWTVIDDDLLLPHNLARHVLSRAGVGFSKAECVAAVANNLTAGDSGHRAVTEDVLAIGGTGEAVAAALREADLIVDMSASVTVARELAMGPPAGIRRVSLFLNPTGTDLVLLAESSDRALRLDALEMQYYRALLAHPELAGALKRPPSIRYGRSCRDVSLEMPQGLAAIHAGIGAQALERLADSPEGSIKVWRVDRDTLEVRAIQIKPAPVMRVQLGNWTVVIDEEFLAKIAMLREAKLPNETGGVLIGSIDLARRIIYLVGTIPSPPDSQEWPVLYIRGCVGLAEEEARVRDVTADQLHYIGEWHSHPTGHSCRPSRDDVIVFAWLTERMDADGLPALMAIVGDDGLFVPYLGEMVAGQGHPAEVKPE